jgi:hypothetical protein
MVESTSERSPRAASTSSRSRYARLAVRGLVVAGLAGAAWLLSSSAAHASERVDGTNTAARAGDGTHCASAGARRSGVCGAEAGRSGTAVGGLIDLGLLGSGTLTRHEATGGTGLLESPVLQPVLRTVIEPVGTVVDKVHGTVGGVVNANAPGDAVAANPVAPVSRSRSAGATVSSGFTRTTPVKSQEAHGTTATEGPVQRGAATRHRATSGDRPAQAGEPVNLRRTSHVPLLPRPAPAPVVPGGGLISGVPSMGSGLIQDGGAPAIVLAVPASGRVHSGRPEAADDVAVRPLIAESPTVSPD